MRIVVLTANFAPRGGSHPTRTVHFAKYLRLLGHEVKVLTYAEQQQRLYSSGDESLAAKVPSDVEVIRVPAGWLHRVLGRAKQRGNETSKMRSRAVRNPLTALFIPDPHITAKRNFVNAAMSIVAEWHPDVLVTCAYPFTMTLIGATVKRVCPDLVWIADYGDPWTGAPVAELKLPGWRRILDRKLESRALACSDAVTVTTEPTADLYRQQFPMLADRIHVLTMGYDPDDDTRVALASRPVEDTGKLVVLHAGRLYREARNPAPFITAVEKSLASDPVLFSRMKVVLLGAIEPEIAATIRESSAAALFEIHGWVTVAESLARMKAADVLLLFGNKGSMQIPGKVYQYFGTGRPVLMIFESENDPTVDVVRQYGRALLVQNSAEALATALRGLLTGANRFTDGEINCRQYSWPSIVLKLADIAASSAVRNRTRSER